MREDAGVPVREADLILAFVNPRRNRGRTTSSASEAGTLAAVAAELCRDLPP
jgi:hypothetical protein